MNAHRKSTHKYTFKSENRKIAFIYIIYIFIYIYIKKRKKNPNAMQETKEMQI